MMSVLRTANTQDAHALVPLIVSAIEDLADQFTGTREPALRDQRMAQLIQGLETRFSAQYGLAVEVDGQLAAMGFAYPGSAMKRLTANTLAQMEAAGAVFEEHERLWLLGSREAHDDEFYIDNLAVDPVFQGRGYSRLIIEAFERRAGEQGFNKVSILADLHNPKAKAIYEKMGYVADEVFHVLGHDYDHMVKNL